MEEDLKNIVRYKKKMSCYLLIIWWPLGLFAFFQSFVWIIFLNSLSFSVHTPTYTHACLYINICYIFIHINTYKIWIYYMHIYTYTYIHTFIYSSPFNEIESYYVCTLGFCLFFIFYLIMAITIAIIMCLLSSYHMLYALRIHIFVT